MKVKRNGAGKQESAMFRAEFPPAMFHRQSGFRREVPGFSVVMIGWSGKHPGEARVATVSTTCPIHPRLTDQFVKTMSALSAVHPLF